MCGHDTIGVSTALIESGLLKAEEPYTYATLDNLLGRSATATIYFETGAAAYNATGSSTFSCKFVAAN